MMQHRTIETIKGKLNITGVAVDSRAVQNGNLFVALKGEKLDGHQFLEEASAKGAVAAFVDENYQGPPYDLLLLKVRDPLVALQELARRTLKDHPAIIIGVTGSLGKTTTKEFIAELLRTKFKVCSSPGNQNSQVGLPLAILNHVKGDEEVLVFEMGMTHANQISRLVNIAPPDIAVITTVSPVHIGNFSTFEDLVRAKAEIFSHPKTKIAILPRETPLFDEITASESYEKVTFSLFDSRADYRIQDDNGYLLIKAPEGLVSVSSLDLPGKHNQHNLLAAIATVRTLGVLWSEIHSTIPKLTLPEKRFQETIWEGCKIINDSYNSSEFSVKAALESLPTGKGKRIAVLGDIVDLGSFAQRTYESIGKAALSSVDSLICLGTDCGPMVQCWQEAHRPVVWCYTLEEVVTHLHQQMQEGDVVLLKGSNKHALWKVLSMLQTSSKKLCGK